jgi:hypothetical protein
MLHSWENPEKFNRVPNHIFERISKDALDMMGKNEKAKASSILENDEFKKKAIRSWKSNLIKGDPEKREIELAKGLKIRLKEELDKKESF